MIVMWIVDKGGLHLLKMMIGWSLIVGEFVDF
jgi:hypothetical protein